MSYIVIARWVARNGHQADIEDILRELVPRCRIEPGCRGFVAHQSVDRPNEFFLYEHYGDENDFADHQTTPHFQELVLKRALPLLEYRERVPYRIVI